MRSLNFTKGPNPGKKREIKEQKARKQDAILEDSALIKQ